MLGLTLTPKSPSAMAILSVVRRDHFSPVMGSPAVSYSSRNSISVTMSAFFFRRVCGRRRPAGATRCHILIEQLLASAGDGVWIQAKEFGQDTVAAVSQLDGFQAGEQATLLFVQQTVEQHDGSLEFLGRNLKGGGIGQQRNGERGLSGAHLIP